MHVIGCKGDHKIEQDKSCLLLEHVSVVFLPSMSRIFSLFVSVSRCLEVCFEQKGTFSMLGPLFCYSPTEIMHSPCNILMSLRDISQLRDVAIMQTLLLYACISVRRSSGHICPIRPIFELSGHICPLRPLYQLYENFYRKITHFLK